MTTQEAFDELSAKYPGMEIKVWEWISVGKYTREPGKPDYNFSIDIDGFTFRGESLADAVANVKLKTPEEKAKELREQAAALIEQAKGYEGVAAVTAEEKE